MYEKKLCLMLISISKPYKNEKENGSLSLFRCVFSDVIHASGDAYIMSLKKI